MSIAMTIFSLLGTFIIGFSMFPQTILTMKTRDTAKLSLALYFVMGLATMFITIYGVGLCVIPESQVKAGDGLSQKARWITGWVLPGAAIIFGELICSVTSFMIAFVKLNNMIKAKKAGMSEAEYVEKHYGDIIKANEQKAQNKVSFSEKMKSIFHRG